MLGESGGIVVSTINQLEHCSGVERAAALARQQRQAVLISRTLRIDAVDPLDFFAAGTDSYGGERGVLADPGEMLTLVGVGVCDRIDVQTSSRSRFTTVEKEWNRRLERLVTEGPFIKGAGPLLMGGFAFDPEQPGSNTWKTHLSASFVLPKYLLTVRKDGCWLTANRWIAPDENETEIARIWEQEQAELLQRASQSLRDKGPATWEVEEVAPQRWKETVRQSAADIRAGILRKVVLARELRLKAAHPFVPEAVLSQLRREQTNNYLFAMERGNSCFVGATPERLVKRDGDQLLSACMASTIRRSEDPDEDRQLKEQLMQDAKNREEHAAVVSMIRAVFQRECESVEIPDAPTLYTVRNMHHLFTPVTGYTRSDTTLLSMVGHLHPTPAMGGFPQADATAMIREREGMDRGWFAGPVGWIDRNGDGEFVVAIRSGVLRDKCAFLFAGCGIVGDSDPESEYEETKIKFQPMLSALKGAGEE